MDLKDSVARIKTFYRVNKKRVLIGSGILAAVIIAAVFLLANSGNNGEETQVTLVNVITGNITESIDVVGSLKAVPSITLSWESRGIISPFELSIGDQVDEDQLLMTLEDNSLSSTILQAQSSLLEAEAALENLMVSNTDLHTAAQTLADLEYALIDYKADRDYWNYNGASWDTIEKARDDYYAREQIRWEKEAAYDALSDLETDDPARIAAYEERKAAIQEADKYHHYLSSYLGVYYDHAVETDFIEYDQALGDVEQARNAYNRYLDQSEEIAAAEANVQALQNIIDQARIVAPFAGTVTEINAVSGELVSSGTRAVRIDNLDQLMVDVYVSEVDINKVAPGQKTILTFDALPNREYTGFVESISSAGTDESGVVEFRVRVVIEDADEEVKPGFTTVVSIITSEIVDALLVPNQAIQIQNGVPVVMKVNSDGSITAVPVQLGAVSDAFTQVLSGDISAGDQLAVITTTSISGATGFDPSAMREMRQEVDQINNGGAGSGSGSGSGQK